MINERSVFTVPDGTPFPAGFRFGCATAAYQIEGGIENDWSEWERAGHLKDPNGRCGRAVDHWQRYASDFDLLSDLGVHDYRMSVEWARIEPRSGQIDDAALRQYRAMIDDLRRRGIAPLVTFHHFTHPSWFARETPWHDERCVERFAAYVRTVVEALGDGVEAYFPFNEPMVLLFGGLFEGVIPPGVKNPRLMARAFANMLRCHAQAYHIVKERYPAIKVGPVCNIVEFAPFRTWHPGDRFLTRVADTGYNLAFLDALRTGRARLVLPGFARIDVEVADLAGAWDFLGLNYYTRMHPRMKLSLRRPIALEQVNRANEGLTDLGWEIFPAGFYYQLERLYQRFGMPIWITENGIADDAGTTRVRYMHDHLMALLAAVRGKAVIERYLYWTLMDNFEWLEGLGPRFGLYRVDFETLARTPTAGQVYLKQTIAKQSLVPIAAVS